MNASGDNVPPGKQYYKDRVTMKIPSVPEEEFRSVCYHPSNTLTSIGAAFSAVPRFRSQPAVETNQPIYSA